MTISPTTTTSYWVEARNDCANGTAESQTATVTVCTRPAIPSSGAPNDRTITRGQTAKLVVSSVTGTTPVIYQWFTVAGTAVTPIAGATGAVLYVSPAQTTVYQAEVTNSCGTTSANATVTVVAKPTTPQDVRATYDFATGAVTVNWSASTTTVGSIAAYLVTRQPDNRSFESTGTSASDPDSAILTRGAAYSYTVRARDSRSGYSEPSALDFAPIVARIRAGTG